MRSTAQRDVVGILRGRGPHRLGPLILVDTQRFGSRKGSGLGPKSFGLCEARHPDLELTSLDFDDRVLTGRTDDAVAAVSENHHRTDCNARGLARRQVGASTSDIHDLHRHSASGRRTSRRRDGDDVGQRQGCD